MFYFNISVNYAQICAWQLGPAPAVKISNGTGVTDFQVRVPATNDVAALFGCVLFGFGFDLFGASKKGLAAFLRTSGPIDVYPLKLTINPVCNAGNNRVIRNEVVEPVAV